MTRSAAAVAIAIVALAVSCADEDEKRPPLVTGGSGGTHPCERIRGLCASAATCGEGRVSAGSSVGCEGTGAVCCIFGSDAATDAAGDAASD